MHMRPGHACAARGGAHAAVAGGARRTLFEHMLCYVMLLELSSLDPGLGARARGERRAASIARGSRRTRSKKRSGWDYASVGHLVCLVQTCVKG